MKMTVGGFSILRKSFGSLNQDQVDNINLIIEYCNKHSLEYNQAAYVLATAWHETNQTMLPIKEYGGYKYLSKYDTGKLAKDLGNTPEADGDGQKYAGRGHVMITGASNYKRIGSKIGVDLFNDPDLALVSDNSVKILVMGMKEGWFTGKKLSHYITRTTKDYKNARRIINGVDKAQKISNEATIFEKALRSY